LTALGIAKQQACRLNAVVAAPYYVEDAPAEEQSLSFCSGAVQ
jgi:hypothetical protein